MVHGISIPGHSDFVAGSRAEVGAPCGLGLSGGGRGKESGAEESLERWDFI
jgi:hypothetical protein